jgi:hypothetical protein
VQSGLVSVSDSVAGLFAAFCSESRPNVVLVARVHQLGLLCLLSVSVERLEHIALEYSTHIQSENLCSSEEALDFFLHISADAREKEFFVTSMCRR